MDGWEGQGKSAVWRLATGVVVLGVSVTLSSAEPIGPLVVNARLKYPADSAVAAQMIQAAAQRLADPRCQRLFAEFGDATGRPLSVALNAEGTTAPQFLGRLFFYEGSERHCRSRTLAYTTPGSRVVFVCSTRFRKMSERNGAYVQAAVIHEALHALGLGENPPTWEEITARVLDSCRH